MKKLILILILFCLSPCLLGQAQNLNVKEKIGIVNSFTISTIKSLTFSNGNLNINNIDGSSSSFILSNIQNLNFASVTKSIYIKQKEENKALLKLFPDPVEDQLNINYLPNLQKFIHIDILSIDGKIIYSQIVNSKEAIEFSINASTWKHGLYICRINNGGIITSLKFIKN